MCIRDSVYALGKEDLDAIVDLSRQLAESESKARELDAKFDALLKSYNELLSDVKNFVNALDNANANPYGLDPSISVLRKKVVE